MASVHDIQHRRLTLTKDGIENDPHRPDISLWADEGDDESPRVVVALSSMWGQPARFLELTQDEARTLATLLKQVADDIDSVTEIAA